MLRRRLLGALAVPVLITLAACPPRDQAGVGATDTIVPPPATTAPPVTPMPMDTPMMRPDTPMIGDTLMRDTPRIP